MNTIKFSHNWNRKLEQTIFTTIRSYNSYKYDYYMSKCEQTFDIVLNEISIGRAILVGIEKVEFADILASQLMVDTGLTNINDILELFRKFGITTDYFALILTFKRL